MAKTCFLQKAPGDFSSSRLGFLLILIVALFLTVVLVWRGKPIIDVVSLFTTMMTSAITLKGLSKKQELQEGSTSSPQEQ